MLEIGSESMEIILFLMFWQLLDDKEMIPGQELKIDIEKFTHTIDTQLKNLSLNFIGFAS